MQYGAGDEAEIRFERKKGGGMSEILFHPSMRLEEAVLIARGQGGSLVRRTRLWCIRQAQRHVDAANEAAIGGNHEVALQQMRLARAVIDGGLPCKCH
jgi:hypothetical protein